jgi:ribonuclease R
VRQPEAELVERLGKNFEPGAELRGVLAKFNLIARFPPAVEAEVKDLAPTVPPAQLTGREDYREIFTFTIDPDDAKDFDDALSLEARPDGGVRIGVHIADVSAYVRPGTQLDAEARKRGNSTYLVGAVIPMLPEKLSNGLCSLVEAEDRLCKATLLTFDAKFRLQQTEFANTVIRSRKRLTYKQAYALLKENDLAAIRALPLPPKHQTGSTGRALASLSDGELIDLQQAVRKLWTIGARLRRARMEHGSLDLDMPETKIFVDAEGYADRLEKIEHDESHQLIEEFMLAANEAVARLTRQQKLPSVYRVHDDPDEERLRELRSYFATYQLECGDLTERKEIVRLLASLRDHPQGYMLRTQLLRSLKKAAYRAAPDGHFGLHKNDYTHFTSPIRRYADLVVHRVLDTWLVKSGAPSARRDVAPAYTPANADTLAEHLSLTEVNSAEAERESVKIKMLEYFERDLAKKVPSEYAAIITDVRSHGLFIELTQSMAFGFIPARELGEDQFMPSASGAALVGRKSKKKFTLGDAIHVRVHKVDRHKRLIDFRPI